MKHTILRYSLLVGLGCSTFSLINTASAVSPEFRMLGLAMHQDTGRNIYLGAIHLGGNSPAPDDLMHDENPKSMEYRVIARRTSIRNLLGTMLLQSEVATGNSPSGEIVDFADQVLSSVKGSLYAGDSFEIRQAENMQVQAFLNDLELASTEDIGIFDYLLMGWISENGPSSTFRSSIMQQDINGSLLSAYGAHTPSEDRVAAVAAWTTTGQIASKAEIAIADASQADSAQASEAAITAVTAVTITPLNTAVADISVAGIPVADISVADTKVASMEEGTLPDVVVESAEVENHSDDIANEAATDETIATAQIVALVQPQSTPDAINTAVLTKGNQSPAFEQLASLGSQIGTLQADEANSDGLEPAIGTLDEIQALDITQYSSRLSAFNDGLIKLVYSNIKYPRRAVRRDIQGALELDVTIQADGSLVAVAVAESSGYSILDKAAVAAAEEAFEGSTVGSVDPVAVAEYGDGDTLVVPIPVAFVLQ